MERQHLAQPLVLQVAGHESIDRSITLQADHVGHDARHVAWIEEWTGGELREAFVEDVVSHSMSCR